MENKLINTTTRPTQTYSFSTYGNNIPNVRAAINEFVWNALGYGKRIAISTKGGRLIVENDGKFANPNHIYQYGISSSKSEYSYYGSGSTQATAFINPANDDFRFLAKQSDGVIKALVAPFCPDMLIGDYSGPWPYHKWSVSAFDVKDQNGVLSEYTELDAGIDFGLAIVAGYEITLNGKKVKPVLPTDNTLRAQQGSIDIHDPKSDAEAILEYTQITLNDVFCGTEVFPKNLDSEGLYLYFNNCFIGHYGVSRFMKTTGTGYLKDHQCMNKYRTMVNIKTEGLDNPLKVPFTNMKTEIKWNTSIGKFLREEIDAAFGGIYREKSDAHLEKVKRVAIDQVLKAVVNGTASVSYEIEATVAPGAIADAIVYRGKGEYSLERVLSGEIEIEEVIEFKPSNVLWGACTQGLGYAMFAYGSNKQGAAKLNSNATPCKPSVVVIGQIDSKPSENLCEIAKDYGLSITVCKYDKKSVEAIIGDED